MEPSPTKSMSARAERRALIALAAIFALLVQVIVPSMAMAMPMAADGGAICAPQTPTPAAKAPPASPDPARDLPAGQCGHCGHCIAAPTAAALAEPVAEPVAILRYAQAIEPPRTKAERRPPVRAPPRPPGQGPPLPNA